MASSIPRKKSSSGTKVAKSHARIAPAEAALLPSGLASGQIVGIGASAGGLEALKAFFGAMPADIGLAFVIVMHLDPTHESLMAELLAHVTELEVEQATDRQPLESNHVYVIPPNRRLTLEHGILRVQEVEDRRALRVVIDHFLRSLAAAEGDRSIAILLSGIGTEGTLGARAVKAAGGLVMAQAPETAIRSGMPSSVIEAGIVDVVAAPDKLAAVLTSYARNPAAHNLSLEVAERKPGKGLSTILAVLRARTKFDFRGYKKGSLQRRIERRMGLQQMQSIAQYAEFLRSNPAEVDQLFKDMLIGVTSFFRDPEAFDELSHKVLASLLREHDQDVSVRVWVPGCSTGEEAYSIAIVLAEALATVQSAGRVQVFATDADEEALEIARSGSYPESIALDVTPQRLRRFFTQEDHRYTIAKSIRESVVFAAQNLISDPPFSKLDLVSCRNVLIYLEPEMQQKLLTLFHFALKPGGYLFLGSAEGIGGLGELFTPVSKARRIFRRIGPAGRSPLELAMPAAVTVDAAARAAARAAAEPSAATLADQKLLGHYAPTAVVVRSSGHIVRFYGAMERYMKLPTGEATFDVLTLVRNPLKATLRAAFSEAVRRNRQAVTETLDLGRGRERKTLRITIKPVDGPRTVERCWLIIFEEAALLARPRGLKKDARQTDLVRRLESELRATKKEQKHLIEQLESSNEELQTANEEVLAMNEELQSTNEELTTSKEELQSMNEELTTLNTQLQDKVHELTVVNDDLGNLLVSTDIATVFLDMELRVKRFTSTASQVLNLLAADIGRPMNHIAHNLVDVDMVGDARAVLSRITPLEKEVAAQDGKQYFLRVLPYRTVDKQVQGVVVTLVDITTLKHAERDLRIARERVAEDLRRMTRLHELGALLAAPRGDTRVLLEEILRAALDITGAQMGDIQVREASDTLTIAAQVGFEQPFLDYFAKVDAQGHSPCAQALVTRERVIIDDVSASPIFAGTLSLPVMLAAGSRAVQSTPLFDRSGSFIGMFSTHYRALHAFAADELRWLDLLARYAGDALERQHANELLARSHEELEQRVAERTQSLALMHEVSRMINEAPTWDEALHRVLRSVCEMERWQVGYVYLPSPETSEEIVPAITYSVEERFLPFHEASQRQHYTQGQSLPGRVYAEGAPIWADDQEELLQLLLVRSAVAKQLGLRAGVALPVTFRGQVIAALELLSDQPHPPSEQLSTLMRDVSDQIARVIDRERLTAQMADLVWREQQDLLHTLHDALGQTLTGLGMLSSSLRERLASVDAAAADTAAEIARQAQEALEQVRKLTKTLFPVDVEAQSLTAALRALAATTESLHDVRVRVEGDLPAGLRDGGIATQLYRIVQEAVTNAAKHAQARTITIKIDGDPALIRLQVVDDGVGIRVAEPSNGMGLKIMRHRASSIGGKLTVESGASGGTVMTCTVRTSPRP